MIYTNRLTGREMHVNLDKYNVYQQPEADKYKANLYMTMHQFADRWNIIVYDSLRHLETNIFLSICYKQFLFTYYLLLL